MRLNHAGATQAPGRVVNLGASQLAQYERVQTETRGEKQIERIRINLVTGLYNDSGPGARIRPPPYALVKHSASASGYSHAGPGVRQTVRKTSTRDGENARGIKGEEPNARMAVGRSHVGAAIRFWELRNPGKRWKWLRAQTSQEERRDTHPCRSIKCLDLERRRHLPPHDFNGVSPVQKRQVAPVCDITTYRNGSGITSDGFMDTWTYSVGAALRFWDPSLQGFPATTLPRGGIGTRAPKGR